MSLMFNNEVLTLLITLRLNSALVKFPPLILEALSSNPGVGGSSPTLGRLKVPLSVIGGCVKIIKSKLMSVSSDIAFMARRGGRPEAEFIIRAWEL